MSGRSQFLSTHSGTTLFEYIQRIGELFGIPTLTFAPFPDSCDSDWLSRCLNEQTEQVCYYHELGFDGRLNSDELLIKAATEVRILTAKSGGNVIRLATERLQENELAHRNTAKTMILVDSSLSSAQAIEQLRECNAIDWWLYRDEDHESTDSNLVPGPVQNPIGFITTLDELKRTSDTSEFLLHWTRRRIGPWPDQAEHDFCDDLILGTNSKDHRRIASLSRIVVSRTLIADNYLNRNGTAVVCFSDVEADQLMQRRVFRSHLGRWDFEPCGIAIRKSVLTQLGAKPAIYGAEKDWAELTEAERPFFQIATSKSPTAEIDWTAEREYRICGNVSLESISPGDAFLFVETQEEAETVAPFSRWPVAILAAKGR